MTDSNNHAHANDKLDMHTDNLVDSNINKIAELFPNCITESQNEQGELERAIDFELLKQELSHQVVDGSQERYRLDWVGKRQAILEANTPIAKTLRPVREESVNFDSTENLFIEGDNLDALKLLQESYLGKVKMIYIDPPYNTGNDFIYEDDFSENTQDFLQRSEQIDEDGNRLVANSESNGRFHSDWLTMMYSRLKLARNLLSDDGVIFISCDDSEQSNLKKVCDEILGSNLFVACLTIASNSSKNNSKQISVTHEYVLVYAKSSNKNLKWLVKKNHLDEFKKRANYLFKNLDNEEEIRSEIRALVKYPKFYDFDHYTYIDEKGLFRASDLTAPNSKNFTDIVHPVTKKKCKCGRRGWGFSNESLHNLKKDNLILFGKDETTVPQLKNYLSDNELSTPKSVLFFDSQVTTKWIKENKLHFPFPKPLSLLKYLTEMVRVDKDSIIIDFFAGSATTAHAVMDLNAQDGGKRKFIMVQLPEVTDEKSEAHKAGYETIAEISKERIRRAGQKIVADNADKDGIENLDIGFRVLKIDDTNMKEVYYTPDKYSQDMLGKLESNIKDDRTAEDLLFQVMLDWGVPLDLPITSQNIQGKNVYFVGGNSLVASFEAINADMIDDIAKLAPLKFVSCERAIQKDQDKSNIKERFRQLSPNTEVKFI